MDADNRADSVFPPLFNFGFACALTCSSLICKSSAKVAFYDWWHMPEKWKRANLFEVFALDKASLQSRLIFAGVFTSRVRLFLYCCVDVYVRTRDYRRRN